MMPFVSECFVPERDETKIFEEIRTTTVEDVLKGFTNIFNLSRRSYVVSRITSNHQRDRSFRYLEDDSNESIKNSRNF